MSEREQARSAPDKPNPLRCQAEAADVLTFVVARYEQAMRSGSAEAAHHIRSTGHAIALQFAMQHTWEREMRRVEAQVLDVKPDRDTLETLHHPQQEPTPQSAEHDERFRAGMRWAVIEVLHTMATRYERMVGRRPEEVHDLYNAALDVAGKFGLRVEWDAMVARAQQRAAERLPDGDTLEGLHGPTPDMPDVDLKQAYVDAVNEVTIAERMGDALAVEKANEYSNGLWVGLVTARCCIQKLATECAKNEGNDYGPGLGLALNIVARECGLIEEVPAELDAATKAARSEVMP